MKYIILFFLSGPKKTMGDKSHGIPLQHQIEL